MSVGTQPTVTTIDQQLTYLALQLRNLMMQVRNLNTQVNGAGQGTAYLESLGYSNTANPVNPAGMSDAAYASSLIAQFYVVAGLYYGIVTAPVTVSATAPASPATGSYWVDTSSGGQLKEWDGTAWVNFSFDSAFASLWNGA